MGRNYLEIRKGVNGSYFRLFPFICKTLWSGANVGFERHLRDPRLKYEKYMFLYNFFSFRVVCLRVRHHSR